MKDNAQFGYFNYAKLLAGGKKFVVRTDVTQKNRLVSQLQVRDATTGAVISSIDSEAGADIQGLAVHPGTGQIVTCGASAIKLFDTTHPSGTPAVSRAISNEAW